MTDFDLYKAPGHLLRRVWQLHNKLFSAVVASETDISVTSPQFALLSAVAAWPDHDQATLSTAVAIDRTTIGDLLRRLQSRGWVHRVRDSSDGRRNTVRLTQKGRYVYEHLVPQVERVGQELLEPLTEEERRSFLRLLSTICAYREPDLDESFTG